MTVASIATAFLLFSLGRSVAVAFTNEVDYAGKDDLLSLLNSLLHKPCRWLMPIE